MVKRGQTIHQTNVFPPMLRVSATNPEPPPITYQSSPRKDYLNPPCPHTSLQNFVLYHVSPIHCTNIASAFDTHFCSVLSSKALGKLYQECQQIGMSFSNVAQIADAPSCTLGSEI